VSWFDPHHLSAAAQRRAATVPILVAAAVLAGCSPGQDPPSPESGGTALDTSPAASSAPAPPTPPAAASLADTARPRPDAWPPRNVLKEHSLAVATYGPGDRAACGLPAVQPGDGRGTVVVFHACEPRSGPGVDAVPARRVPVPAGADPLEAAVRAQLAGPTAAEKAAGYQSNFGPGTAATPFTVRRLEGGLAVVDLHPSVQRQPMVFVSNAEARQLVAALGQFPGVERVTILVGGQLLCRAVELC
jgi:hypothetical protein